MSYLTTPELEEFSKAVISFWFRVPQASLDAAQAEADAFTGSDPPPLLGLVPLVVFGKEGTSRTTSVATSSSTIATTSTVRTTCIEQASDSLEGVAGLPGAVYTTTYWSECSPPSTDVREYSETVTSYTPVPGKPVNPSYIAIDGSGNLRISFESAKKGDVTLPWDVVKFTSEYYTQAIINECFTFNVPGFCGDYQNALALELGITGMFQYVFAAAAFRLSTAVPDVYLDTGSSPRVDHPRTTTYGPVPDDVGTGAISFIPPVVLAADTWHHVLVSIDMTDGSVSTGFAVGDETSPEAVASHITKTSTMYVAIDDVNYPTGGNIFPDTNKVVTGGAAFVASTSQAVNYVPNSDGTTTPVPEGPVPSYSIDKMTVPAAEVGIPSVGKYVDRIRKVEMAEFVMWTDAVLDTTQEVNRRYFITAPDRRNKQYPISSTPIYIPMTKTAVGDPSTWDWDSGPDSPAFVPPLSSLDPSLKGMSIKQLGTPAIDFTRCCMNWQMARNLGKLRGRVVKTGRIRAYSPDPSITPAPPSGGG